MIAPSIAPRIAVVAPGQGSQAVGMLTRRLRHPEHAERVRAWSAAADCDLAHLGTRAPAAEIERTENTQPLLVAAGLLALDGLTGDLDDGAAVVAGHSVGELTAAAHAGVLSDVDAVRLAAIRGRAMADACAAQPTSMAAVVGGDEAEVLEWIAALDLAPATFNGPGQIVAAGPVDDLRRLAAAPPPGATVKFLSVAGAFHTRYMAGAQAVFAAAAAATDFRTPRQVLLSNSDGAAVGSGDDTRDRLVGQLVRPVRWDRCLEAIRDAAPAAAVALPPARILTTILKRQLPRLPVLPMNTDRDLAAIRARFTAPTTGGGRDHAAA